MSFVAQVGITQFGWFCLAVLLLNATPGPDTAFIVGQSIAHGRRTGLMSVLGISAGTLVHTAALALGLSALLAASSTAFLVIRIAGAVYLVVLGVRMIFVSRRPTAVTASMIAPGAGSPFRAFLQGLATNVSNPKVILFFVSFIPQFVAPASPSKGVAFVLLGLVLAAISTVWNGAMAWLAGGVTRRMRRIPRVRVWLERSIGAAFVALGARIAFVDR